MPKIKELEDEIKSYNKTIKRKEKRKKEVNPEIYYAKGRALAELANLIPEKKNEYNQEALDALNKAIALDEERPLYFAERSKLYVAIGENDLAVEDMKNASSFESPGGVLGMQLTNTLRDISKLEELQNSIEDLRVSGEISTELARILSEHAQITSGLVVQVGSHSDQLDDHNGRLVDHTRQIDELRGIVESLQSAQLDHQQVQKKLEDEIVNLRVQLEDNTKVIAGQSLDILEIKEDIDDVKQNISSINRILRVTGVTEEAELQDRYHVLEQESTQLYQYFRNFHINIMQMLNAYSMLHTGLISGNSLDSIEKDIMESGGQYDNIKAAGKLVLKVGLGTAAIISDVSIPGAAMLRRTAKQIRKDIEQDRIRGEIEKIHRVIQEKFLSDSNQLDTNILGRIALRLTEIRQDQILHEEPLNDVAEQDTGMFRRLMLDLDHKIGDIADKARDVASEYINSVGPSLERYRSYPEKLAMYDVIRLVIAMCVNSDSISENPGSTFDIIEDIFDLWVESEYREKLEAKDEQLETYLGKKLIAEIQTKAMKGYWHDNDRTFSLRGGRGVEKILREAIVKDGMDDEKISEDLEDIRMIIFKNICIGISEQQNQGMSVKYNCAIGFAEEYNAIFNKISDTRPGLFITSEIVEGMFGKVDASCNDSLSRALTYFNKDRDDQDFKGSGSQESYQRDLGYDQYFNEYYSGGLLKLLQLRINDAVDDSNNIIVLNPVCYYKTNGADVCSNSNLSDRLSEAKAALIEGTRDVLVPCSLYNEHWIGFAFKIQEGDYGEDVILTTYFDSENNKLDDNIVNLLYLVMPDPITDIDVEQFEVQKQCVNNCGPELIENFILYLTDTRLPQEDAVPYHSNIFERELVGVVDALLAPDPYHPT